MPTCCVLTPAPDQGVRLASTAIAAGSVVTPQAAESAIEEHAIDSEVASGVFSAVEAAGKTHLTVKVSSTRLQAIVGSVYPRFL
jgi:hypothetical protein